MPNPGVFLGSRKEFMISQKTVYSAAVLEGYVKDAIANIQRRYFKRYPIDLPHNEEPTAEHLASVDDNAPDPDEPIPDEESLEPEEYQVAMEMLEEKKALILTRKKQIKRWLEYQHMKDNDVDPLESGASNPFNILLFQLTGIGYQKPRQRSAVNVWRRAHRAEIEEKAQEELKAQKGPKRQKLAKIREATASSMFEELSEEDRAYYKDLAKEEHEEAMKKWKLDTSSPPSTKPEDRQKAIQALMRFAQPILDGMCAATGWKGTLTLGGPEPANGGRFRLVTVNSGSLPGPVKMNFTRSEAVAYHKYFIPMFGEFLRKCYSIEECKSRSLPATEGFETLEQIASSSGDMEAIDLGFLNTSLASASPSSSSSSLPLSSTTATLPPLPATSLPVSIINSTTIHAGSNSGTSPQPILLAAQPGSDNTRTLPLDSTSLSPALSQQALPTIESTSSSRSTSPFFQDIPPSPISPPASPIGQTPSSFSAAAGTAVITEMEVDPPAIPTVIPQPAPTFATPTPLRIMSNNTTTSRKRALPSGGVDSSSAPPVSKRARSLAPTNSTAAQKGAGGTSRPKPRPIRRVTDTNTSMPAQPFPSLMLVPSHPPLPRPNLSLNPSTSPTNPLPPSTQPSSPRPLAPTGNNPSTSNSLSSAATDSTHEQLPITPLQSNVNPPTWFLNAMNQFTICPTTINDATAGSLGDDWTQLVAAWSTFERKSGFGEEKKHLKVKLSPKDRPKVVGDWIARARTSNFRPEISNLGSYKDSFWCWWKGLQPEWRVVDGEIQSSRLDGDWSSLGISGINGLVSVMAALLYWGLNASRSPTHTKHWTQAVKECTAVFSVL